MRASNEPAIAQDRYYLCVKGLIRDGSDRVLLLKRNQTTPVDPGLWDLPGGKLDPAELFDDAFRREVCEETGLDVEITGVAGARDWTMPGRRIVYLILKAEVTAGEIALSSEHVEWAWVALPDLETLAIAPQFLPFLAGA